MKFSQRMITSSQHWFLIQIFSELAYSSIPAAYIVLWEVLNRSLLQVLQGSSLLYTHEHVILFLNKRPGYGAETSVFMKGKISIYPAFRVLPGEWKFWYRIMCKVQRSSIMSEVTRRWRVTTKRSMSIVWNFLRKTHQIVQSALQYKRSPFRWGPAGFSGWQKLGLFSECIRQFMATVVLRWTPKYFVSTCNKRISIVLDSPAQKRLN